MVSFGNDGSTAPAGKTGILTPQSRVSGKLSLDNSYGSAAMTFEKAIEGRIVPLQRPSIRPEVHREFGATAGRVLDRDTPLVRFYNFFDDR